MRAAPFLLSGKKRTVSPRVFPGFYAQSGQSSARQRTPSGRKPEKWPRIMDKRRYAVVFLAVYPIKVQTFNVKFLYFSAKNLNIHGFFTFLTVRGQIRLVFFTQNAKVSLAFWHPSRYNWEHNLVRVQLSLYCGHTQEE